MEDDWPCDDDACGEAEADLQCDYCDRPATWHAAWRTPTAPGPAFAYACDEHRTDRMVPLGAKAPIVRLAKREVLTCDRCGRPNNDVEGEEWNMVIEGGFVVGLVCPDCQTPQENAEAVINESALGCGKHEQGRTRGSSKVAGFDTAP